MRLKLALLFLLTVLIPTVFLVYFSLLAVKGEKEILETNMRQRYEAIAGIVLEDIMTDLKKTPAPALDDPAAIEPILFKHTLLFQDEVMIFDYRGQAVDGRRQRSDFGTPTYVAKVGELPYELFVYERYPLLLNQFAAIKERIARHVGIVSLCALAILLGGIFTLGRLFRGWRKTALKAEFISHLVHDLRGPLTSVRMFSEMLDNDRVPNEEKRKEYYRIIFTESEKLIQLANNVLDFSQIENRGERSYPLITEDLRTVVAETVTRFQSHIAINTHRITAELTSQPTRARIHADSISQALMNLLSNAIKYSPAGSEVRIVLTREGKNAVLSVIDYGIGIPKTESKKIFQEYYRGRDSEVRNREGSGLGLALVKYAIMAHRGKISVKSEEGKGSEFRIDLPLYED